MFGSFRKKGNCIKKISRYDYTSLLDLLPDTGSVVDEEYVSTSGGLDKVNCLKYTWTLPDKELNTIIKFGPDSNDWDVKPIIKLLAEKVQPTIKTFNEENKDKFVVYYPADTVEYANTISQGWYLFLDEGDAVLSLECNYRSFNKERL